MRNVGNARNNYFRINDKKKKAKRREEKNHVVEVFQ